MILYMKYDVLIVGAGPSGLFCAYELSQITNMRIAILEVGRPYAEKKCSLLTEKKCSNCKPCSTLTGEGGSAFFHAGKLSFYPAGSGLRRILETEDECKEIYNRINNIFEKYRISLENQDRIENHFFEPYKQEGMDIKYYKSVPVKKTDFRQFMYLFGNDLRRYVTMFYETEVLTVKKDSVWRVTANRKGIPVNFEADKLIISTGEYGFRWWKRMARMLGVHQENQKVDIGVRIECPSPIIEKIWDYHKDVKAKVTAPDGSELRTYCVLKKGQSIYCNYGDFTVLDGISHQGSDMAGITIFNRLGKEHLNDINPIDFAISLLQNFYYLHEEPICIDMASFLREKWVQSEQYYNCTLPNIKKLKNVSVLSELPAFIHENLIFGIKEFNKLIPGLADKKNCILMPVIDNLWNSIILSKHMETSISGLYVIGDATGHMRGIMQACVTGVLCADGIAVQSREG